MYTYISNIPSHGRIVSNFASIAHPSGYRADRCGPPSVHCPLISEVLASRQDGGNELCVCVVAHSIRKLSLELLLSHFLSDLGLGPGPSAIAAGRLVHMESNLTQAQCQNLRAA